MIIGAVNPTIGRRAGRSWWTPERTEVVKCCNKAFKKLKKSFNLNNLIMYKQMQARVRKIISEAKRKCWRQYCDTIGKSTPIDEVWGMIQKMSGVRRVLEHEGILAVKDEEKADMLIHVLANIHSSDSMTTEGKIYRDRTKKEYAEYLENNEERKDTVNASFNLDELKRAINKSRVTSPGKDQISYFMELVSLYYLESRSIMSGCQSGFQKGRSTTDAILCLKSEIRKAQANREIVAAVFFVEKAYDLMWKEGLLTKIKRLGITGPMYNWIKDFFHGCSIQVSINTAFSQQVNVDNGTLKEV